MATVAAPNHSRQHEARPRPKPKPSPAPSPATPARPAALTSIHHPDRFVRNVVTDFRAFLASHGYTTACANEAIEYFDRHRTIRGCESIEHEDWRLVGGYLVTHLEKLLPPPAPKPAPSPSWSLAFTEGTETGYSDPERAPTFAEPSDAAWAALMFAEPSRTLRAPTIGRPEVRLCGAGYGDEDCRVLTAGI